MPCDPSDNSLNIPAGPGIPIPGFGIPFSPIQIPVPNIEFPEGFPEDILDLINELKALFPSGEFSPNLDNLTNNILTALSSIFNQIAPFLSLYNFFQALMNMIMCIIEVLCAIPNPFKMLAAVRRLIKRCLPPFLNLFPWLALIAMILALLLLILALIDYIIAQILKLIRDLIANLIKLSKGLTLQDDDAILATTRKIAQLLCLIQDLIAVLTAVASILAIINALANIGGRSVCGGSGAPTVGDDVNCCDEPVCPPFISESPDGISGIQGTLRYYNQIGTDVQSLLGIDPSFLKLSPLRSESWQFYDQNTNQTFSFADIITPIGTAPEVVSAIKAILPSVSEDGNIYFPDGAVFDKDTNPRNAPYTVDLKLKSFDPGVFVSEDVGGPRDFTITDLIVIKKPTVGVLNFDNTLDKNINSTGTLSLAGGKIFESDGSQYLVGGEPATIESFIHLDESLGSLPSFDDGYAIEDIEFTLVIHHAVLINYGLITLGCHPDLIQERIVANEKVESTGFAAVAERIPNVGNAGFLPDALGTQECALNALNKFRSNITEDAVDVLEAELLGCLNNFRNETISSYENIFKAGVSVFESTIEINPSIQFTTRGILVSVLLKDPNGTNIGTNIPEEISNNLSGLLKGHVTLGNISDFSYDGYDTFNAEITSKIQGDGILTVSFDDELFKNVINSDNDDVPSAIEINEVPYTFVGATTEDPAVRRDEGDVARDRNIG